MPNNKVAVSRTCSESNEPVNYWFELTYAQYLTIPRSVLQAMPEAWQRRFVECLEELDDAIDWRPDEDKQYQVVLREIEDSGRNPQWGDEVEDKFMNYRHPTKIEVRDIWSDAAIEKFEQETSELNAKLTEIGISNPSP